MKETKIENDIRTFYVQAKSFPEGVKESFQKLHSMLPNVQERKFYGISHGTSKGAIIYKAAIEESFPGEAEQYGLPVFTIKKGNYAIETHKDYMEDVSVIGKTFHEMLKHPQLDENGYCLERYIGFTEVDCMIKLKDH